MVGAVEAIPADDSVLARVLESGLRNLESGHEHAFEAMQVTGEEETMKLEHQLGYLASIGSVASMAGLLGTVEGMVGAFTVIAARTTTPPAERTRQSDLYGVGDYIDRALHRDPGDCTRQH